MATVFDVAQYILELHGSMTTMKLQKLVYYCQAWHIAWTDNILFSSRIEAWADGPVVPDLFRRHQGSLRISSLREADSSRLSKIEKNTIKKVMTFYGDKSPQWLIDLTHQEAPWRDARSGVPDRAISNQVITREAMGRFYSSL